MTYILLAIACGALIAIYMPMNAQVAGYLESPIAANIVLYGFGLMTMSIFLVLYGQVDALKNVQKLPVHLFLVGFLSGVIMLCMTYLISFIGARKLFILVISGQVLMAMVVGHFQLFGGTHDPITARKVLGALLLILGLVVSISVPNTSS